MRRALLIGINYTGSENELGGCVNDSYNLYLETLKNCGFKRENVLFLTDSKDKFPELITYPATKNNILRSFSWLLSDISSSFFQPNANRKTQRSAATGNSYFFAYSGHGGLKDSSTETQEIGSDCVIYPQDFQVNGSILDDEIREQLVNKIGSGDRLFALMDACHSASSMDLRWACTLTQGPKGDVFGVVKCEDTPETLGEVVMLSGCMDNETSSDIVLEGKGCGALTHSFISSLKDCNFQIDNALLLQKVRDILVKGRLSSQKPCMTFGRKLSLHRKFML